ncbi:B12-binding domain-containing radical SAM protein [Patescibacteria group bacterium]
MTKILFIQKEATEKFGVMTLSALLKQAGHKVEMFIELLEKEPAFDFIKLWQPDFIAFSITTLEKDWAINLAAKLKKRVKVFTIFGGAEATYNPWIIKNDAVDFVCRGEGEKGFLKLINRIENNKSLKGINNIWIKEKGKVIKSNLGRLITNLDKLTLPDRELYYKYPLLKNLSTKKFLCSRGCPYNCSYCSNHAYRKLVKGKGKLLRYRNPEIIIKEIKEVKLKYGLKTVYFADETFTLNHNWLFELLKLYRKKIRLPFSCMARANELNEDVVKALKQSGCFYLSFGLESGSEKIRNKILKRNLSDEEMLKASVLLHKYDIPFLTHSMFVLPTETLNDALKTVTMNIKMGTDSVWDTVLQPFHSTAMYKFCQQKKLLKKREKIDSTHGTSMIKNADKKQIENLRKLDWLTIKLPWLLPLTKKLVYLPNNIVFELILKTSELYSFRRRYRLGFWEMIRLAWGTGKKLG